MIRTYNQMHRIDKYSQHSSIIWPVWLNGWVFVYELSGCVFESGCSHLKIFTVKNRKSEHHHWIPHIQISLGIKFPLKLTILIFLTRFAQKGFYGLKQKKWTLHIFYIILHIHIILVRDFSSNWQLWFFGSNLPKKVSPVKNRKSGNHHGVLHIWIGLGTKFQLELIILSFLTKFTQKDISSRKQNKKSKDCKRILFV